MTIRNIDSFIANLWDWGFLDDCFSPTKIRVTDVDGLVERNGHFLMIETKSSGHPIPMGQAILFDRLIEDSRWSVLVIWGDANKPESIKVWGYHKKSVEADEEEVQAIVRRWFKYADKQKKKKVHHNDEDGSRDQSFYSE